MSTVQQDVLTESERNLNDIIKVEPQKLKSHLGAMVRDMVEDALNGMLDAETDRPCNAGRYEHSEASQDQRASRYSRKLQTQSGEVTLKVPKLRKATFETAIVERYRRRESSVEEALMEMCLAEVSVRRVEGSFPDSRSALMLATARLRHIAGTKWSTRRYLDMGHLYEQEQSSMQRKEATAG